MEALLGQTYSNFFEFYFSDFLSWVQICPGSPIFHYCLYTYNSILPKKFKVNVSTFFQKFNIIFVYKFQFWSNIFIHQVWTSLKRIDLLIDRVSVANLPLIMYLTTAICFFPSWNGLKFSIIPVLKSAFFLVHTKKQCCLYCMYLNLFLIVASILYSNGF